MTNQGADGVVALLAREVAALTPVDEREAGSQARLLAELDRLERPFDEHADRVHVTASAIVVGPRGILLHRHKRLGLWLQPGGHIETGETPWDAAVREVCEEAGMLASHPSAGPALTHVDVHPGPRGHTHLDLRYLLHAGDSDPKPAPGESQDVAWFGLRDAIAAADPGLVGALRRVATGAPSTRARPDVSGW